MSHARIIEVMEQGHYLSTHRGFMVVKKERVEKGRVPLADISVLLLTGQGTTLSTNLVNALIDQNAMIVFCGSNFQPSGLVWPTAPHHKTRSRLGLQVASGQPLRKRIWQQVVKNKIRNQKRALESLGILDHGLEPLIKRVGSGDPENCEAQAARKYWPLLFGKKFRRDPEGLAPNSLLNYGYAILRSATGRAVATCGLNPALGIHHHNESNPFCLVDDLMEPFRPLVDLQVKKLVLEGKDTIDPGTKKVLAGILIKDLKTKRGNSPLSNCLLWLAQSFVRSLERGKADMEIAEIPKPEKDGESLT